MTTANNEIRIVALDEEKSRRSDQATNMYYMYLRLSQKPPSEWSEIFGRERSFPRHTMWRRAWIEDRYIVVHCPPEEIEQYHLQDLKQDVKNTNAKYQEYLAQEEEKRVRAEASTRAERDRLKGLNDRLNFNDE